MAALLGLRQLGSKQLKCLRHVYRIDLESPVPRFLVVALPSHPHTRDESHGIDD